MDVNIFAFNYLFFYLTVTGTKCLCPLFFYFSLSFISLIHFPYSFLYRSYFICTSFIIHSSCIIQVTGLIHTSLIDDDNSHVHLQACALQYRKPLARAVFFFSAPQILFVVPCLLQVNYFYYSIITILFAIYLSSIYHHFL